MSESATTIEEIWDALLRSDNGHIALTVPTRSHAEKIKRLLSQHKHATLSANPNISEMLGHFKLRFEILQNHKAWDLHVYQDSIQPPTIPIIGQIKTL